MSKEAARRTRISAYDVADEILEHADRAMYAIYSRNAKYATSAIELLALVDKCAWDLRAVLNIREVDPRNSSELDTQINITRQHKAVDLLGRHPNALRAVTALAQSIAHAVAVTLEPGALVLMGLTKLWKAM